MRNAVGRASNRSRQARITVNAAEAVQAKLELAAQEERRPVSTVINNVLITCTRAHRSSGQRKLFDG
jgi:hypothetical protein